MGRLNYTNRKIEGLKLGQVVAKDLLKRIPPAAGHKAALRDPCVELDVSGKMLTDNGFNEVAQALSTTIEFAGEHGEVIKLEEICLRDNQLTVKSLVPLAKVIALAAYDLRDLDLSDNLISITTKEEAEAWELFLQSFSRCCVLRRVDLGGNALGPKAFEVFARVYGNEEPLDLLTTTSPHAEDEVAPINGSVGIDGFEQEMRRISMASEVDGFTSDTEDTSIRTPQSPKRTRRGSTTPQKISPAKHGNSASKTDLFHTFVATRGLRSVPYLILSDTHMTDTCALYLSYVIAVHHLPIDLLPLVPPAKAGPALQQLDAYDVNSGCLGIIYLPNTSLTTTGRKVLELSELARVGSLNSTVAREEMPEAETPQKQTSSARRASEALASPSSQAVASRRRSTVSVGTGEQTTQRHTSGELDRARSRIQGDTLREVGPKSNDLWIKALEMLALARLLLLRPRGYMSEARHDDLDHKVEDRSPSQHVCTMKAAALRPSVLIPLATASPNQTIKLRHPRRRKESTMLSDLTMTPTASPAVIIAAPVTPTTMNHARLYRSNLLGGLYPENWAYIIALGTESGGIVAGPQREAIVKWAMDRGTLEKEQEILGKSESAQIWKVLESTGCLAYNDRSQGT
ncbi:MAG: hypothetical protein Q9187_001211 [Circinaria calcarea]